ncbi:hypothetical protein [Polyangium aurulentum]|uniref:hypothetical protein n=1 Tax=Polyangium aurulentum TaxID=2567896 RepID=UPI0010AE0335|nr:hypothetical protein [Polyangium aurulentum]UQA56633.1 hypothetical protein E8A73_035800 [Polyangium aurulentum]
MDPRRSLFPILPLSLFLLPSAIAGCGGAQADAATADSAMVSCPDPIGDIPRESCNEIADDFGALSVSGALKLAGSSKGAEQRIEAIRSAGELAAELKDRRVALCEQYNACKVAPAAHAAEDARLAGIMKALIDAWDARKFQNPDDVDRFRAQVTSMRDKLEGRAPAAPGEPAPPAGVPGVPGGPVKITADALARIEAQGLSFSGTGGAVTVTATGEGNRDALHSTQDKLPLIGGARYLVRIEGSYTPASPPLIHPGDEITVRLKYRAAAASEIVVALRSLEDPDAVDATSSFRLVAGAGTQQAAFTASPTASGFYVGVGVRGGAVDIDDLEIASGATILAAARGENANEPNVKSGCTVVAQKAIAGRGSLRCEPGEGDKLTIGMPVGHLYLAIRTAAGERALLRTLSLAGGRSLDATVTEDAQLFVGLAGPGTATLQSVAVQTLRK